MRGTKLLAVMLVAPLAAVFAACNRPGAAPRADAGPMVVGPENVAIVRRETIRTGPRIAGSLEPAERAVIRAEVGGPVANVNADIGQPVRAGDPLARIQETTLRDAVASARSAIRSAEADLSVARRNVERDEHLARGGAISERELDVSRSGATGSEARVEEARSRLTTIREQMGDARVTSPIDGVVAERSVSQGDIVAPGAPLFTIIDPSSMRLEAAVPSEALQMLTIGAPVEFEVRGYPGQTFAGTIQRIAPAADPATRQIPILVSIPNPGGRLVAGLFAEGRISTQSRESLVVPFAAIGERPGGEATVVRVRRGRAEHVEVSLGLRDERTERVEVRSGLAAGDTVLLGAAREIAPGTPVRLVPADARDRQAGR